MTRTCSPRDKPLRAFLKMLWKQPLWAAPFALFFGTIYGRGSPHDYLQYYVVSLLFAVTISTFIWANEQFVVSRLRAGRPATRGGVNPIEASSYAVASIGGTFVAA